MNERARDFFRPLIFLATFARISERAFRLFFVEQCYRFGDFFLISALPYWSEISPYNLVTKIFVFSFTSLGDGRQVLKVVHCIVSVAIC